MSLKKWKYTDEGSDDKEELLVFGYQCKLFRDDEKARYIDRGKHLIPWMGDETLMIDRYDCRGHLSDIRPYDAEFVDVAMFHFTEKELAMEAACNEERFLELHTDVREQEMYEEEEMKRLYEAVGEGYAAVGFNYSEQQQDQTEASPPEEEDEPYQRIPELEVPKGVNLPKTMKQHAIIEKTAGFISTQGTQMEIVIATKQKNNPLFNFLNYEDELNVYYKHIIRMIQKKKYQPKPQEYYVKKKAVQEEVTTTVDDTTIPEEPVGDILASIKDRLPLIQVKNTAYGKLLQNLSRHATPPPQGTSDQTELKATYSDCKQNGASAHPTTLPQVTEVSSSTEAAQDLTDQYYHQYYQEGQEGYDQAYIDYYNYYYQYYDGYDGQGYPEYHTQDPATGATCATPAADVLDLPKPHKPPVELKNIIDKMASYVLRNGEDFELLMRQKKDSRFSFLDPGSKYNDYYAYMKRTLRVDLEEETGGQGISTAKEDEEEEGGKQVKLGISFSIRPKDAQSASTNDSAPTRTSKTEAAEKEEAGHKRLAALIGLGSASSDEEEEEEEEQQKAPPKYGDLMNKLAAVTRGSSVTQGKEDDTLMEERKKKVAMFKAKLKTTVPSNVLVNHALGGVFETAPSLSALDSPVSRASTSSKRPHSSASSTSSPSPKRPSPQLEVMSHWSRSPTPAKRRRHRADARPEKRGLRRRSPASPSRRKRRPRRSTSRSRRRSSSRTRRRSRSRRKSPGLPSAYSVVRRSLSPSPKRRTLVRRSMSRKRSREDRRRKSRSRERKKTARSNDRRKKSRKHKRRRKSSSESAKHSSSESPAPVEVKEEGEVDDPEVDSKEEENNTHKSNSDDSSSSSEATVSLKRSQETMQKLKDKLQAEKEKLLKIDS